MSQQVPAKWTRADFRLHPGHMAPEPHWLVHHLYGRVLLACELRRVRPDPAFSVYTPDDSLHPQLDGMIDRLGLRKWPRPSGGREHLQAIALILRMLWALEMSNMRSSRSLPCSRHADASDT